MGHLLIFISFLTLTASAFCQDQQLKVDTFFASNGFSTSRILLSSDSTYFVAESNCTDASIAKGRWKFTNRTIQLLPAVKEENAIKPLIVKESLKDDTGIIFKVFDYFNNPIPYYSITFYDKEGRNYEYETDDKGILTVGKKKFVSFMTFHELYEFDFRNDLTSSVHSLDNSASSISLLLNYPNDILRERPSVRSFQYKGDEFVKRKKLMKSTKSGLTLTKL